MKRLFHKTLAILLSGALLLSFSGCRETQEDGESALPVSAAAAAPDVLRALIVHSGANAEYPSAQKQDREELEALADEIVGFAKESSLNAIFYESAPGGQAMYLSELLPRSGHFNFSAGFLRKLDPLKILTERAAAEGIAVYAVVNPYAAGMSSDKLPKGNAAREFPESTIAFGEKLYYRPDNPEVHKQALLVAQELLQSYPLAGIVVGDADDSEVNDYDGFYTYLAALMSDLSDVTEAEGKQLGLLLSDKAERTQNREKFLDNTCRVSVDFIAPTLSDSAGGALASPYATALETFLTPAKKYQTPVYTALQAEGATAEALSDMLFVNNCEGLQGGVLDGYSMLKGNDSVMEAVIPMLYIDKKILPDTSLEIPTEFRLTRPLDGDRLTIPDRSWDSYYITGTSDPGKPVYFEGEELERQSSNGTFGVLVDVDEGLNTYDFEQDGVTLTAKIYRPYANETTKISKISTYTPPLPDSNQAVGEGLAMIFRCTAPAGGSVSATLDGESYELKAASSAEDGTPVVYRKEVKLPAGTAGEIENLGRVTYTLEYDGETSEVESQGDVYLYGAGRTPVYKVSVDLGTVLDESLTNGNFMTSLKAGSVGEITGQTDTYYKTSFGGFIKKSEVTLDTGLESAENTVTSAQYRAAEQDGGDEAIVLHGSAAASFVVDDKQDGNFTIRLFDTYGVANGVLPAESRFFDSITAKNDGAGTLTFTCKKGAESYFGYNVEYEDENTTVIRFTGKPQISSVKGRPLLGLNIVVDPGHGALDVGALGLAGVTGPMEKNANMYIAHIVARYLEGLGANVFLTRESDEDFLELTERVGFTERHDADLFISLHHNSLNENIDPGKAKGSMVFHYNDISEKMAGVFLEHILDASGRDDRGTEEGYYVVCRTTLAPAILCELGFMPNPEEYEQICNEANMLKIGKAISQAAVDYIAALN
ncbi:N-acetylmuramoyl-L-alanine amidase [Provencibacterium massiliense]|uniref:N-acetylmuramoyl-L-alanine amidase n=1 Tax=Provencibacterium massiliense TaxID=1841868 RepID=UPI0013565F8F|nr:N-acetylmuramoyl-L-alanine amidase [Provencibacterium massiliense]